MLRETRFFSASLVVLLMLTVFASATFGQDTTVADPAADAAAPATGATVATGESTTEEDAAYQKRRKQWTDMLHFINLARADLARSFAEALLADAKPEEIYRHSIEVKGSQLALTRAMGNKKLRPLVASIRKQIDLGYQAYRSDAKEIDRMIKLLSGSLRQFLRASERLRDSGEYAIPMLIAKLSDPKTGSHLRAKIATVLPMGQKANVRALTEALVGTKDESVIQIIANALGEIEYSHSVPHLKEVALNKGITGATRKMVVGALVRCADADRGVLNKSLAELYYKTALKYYHRHDSILPDARFPTANVWYFKSGVLTYTPVPREIFCDVYAMRMARKTLEADKTFSPAVSLWLAAYLRREANLPEGAVDPLVAEGQANAGDYTRAAGCDYAQQVLLRALRDKDTAVALGAIGALRDVAGAKNLPKIIDSGSVQPLVAAMSYPDRRVRFLAAEVLAHALPTETFSGCRTVLPVLSDALREGGSQRVLLLAAGKELNAVTDALRAKSLQVVSAPDSLDAMKTARQVGGVDYVVIVDSAQAEKMLALVRGDRSMATTPTIVVGSGRQITALAKADGKVVLVAPGTTASTAIVEAIPQAAKLAVGKPLTVEEASDWSIRASKAIRLLGLTGNKVYAISQTKAALIAAMADKRVDVSVAAANAMTVIPGPEAQQAIAKTADQTDGAVEVRVPAYKALAESVRRYGNLLTKAQSQAVVDVVNSKIDVSIRKAAAGAMGALNLSSDLACPLIIQSGGID